MEIFYRQLVEIFLWILRYFIKYLFLFFLQKIFLISLSFIFLHYKFGDIDTNYFYIQRVNKLKTIF